MDEGEIGRLCDLSLGVGEDDVRLFLDRCAPAGIVTGHGSAATQQAKQPNGYVRASAIDSSYRK